MDKWSDSEIEALMGRVGSFESGETIGDDYEVEDLIEKGGQGEVYKVKNNKDGCYYVAKVFCTDEDNKKFEEERKVFNKLKSLPPNPHIVHAHPATGAGERKVLILEYVDGPTLKEHIRDSTPSIRASIGFVRQILEGLRVLHDNGIIHRDIKPENIKLADDSKRPVIFDFGISVKEDGSSLSGSAGTKGYTPPEKTVTPAWDVYSGGVLLHELITGRLPVWERGGDKPCDSTDRLVLPCELFRHPSLTHSLRKALAHEPEKRYQNAEEFKRALFFPRIPLNVLGTFCFWTKSRPVWTVILLVFLTGFFFFHYQSRQKLYKNEVAPLQSAIQQLENYIQELENQLQLLADIDAYEVWQDIEKELKPYRLNIKAVIGILQKRYHSVDELYSSRPEETRHKVTNFIEEEKDIWKERYSQSKAGLPFEITEVKLHLPKERDDEWLNIKMKIENADPDKLNIKLKPSEDNPLIYQCKERKKVKGWKDVNQVEIFVWRPSDSRRGRLRQRLLGPREHHFLTDDVLGGEGNLADLHPYPERLLECEQTGYALQFEGRIIPP